MNFRYLLLALSCAGLISCSKTEEQGNRSSPANPVVLEPTVIEREVRTKEGVVQIFCPARDVGCFSLSDQLSRVKAPARPYEANIRVGGPDAFAGITYQTLKIKSSALAQDWLRSLNTEASGFRWANDQTGVHQWLELKGVSTTEFESLRSRYLSSSQYKEQLETESGVEVGGSAFFVMDGKSRLLDVQQQLNLYQVIHG